MSGQPSGRYIKWVNGQPVPAYAEPYTKENLKSLVAASLALPYEPKKEYGEVLPDEERFIGMTNGEVAQIRQAEAAARGDLEAHKYIHDRLLGKPTQHQENLNLTMTVQEFLKTVRETNKQYDIIDAPDTVAIEEIKQPQGEVIRVTQPIHDGYDI